MLTAPFGDWATCGYCQSCLVGQKTSNFGVHKTLSYVKVFAVDACYRRGIAWQASIHWYLQLVSTEWTYAFISSQQGISSPGHWVGAHGLPTLIVFVNAISP